jgi:uncharacterized heparinase superfamily protein
LLNKVHRLFHTLKFLRLRQVLWRVAYFPPRLKRQHKAQDKFEPSVATKHFIGRSGITTDFDRFTFLNETFSLSEVGWDNPKASKLWRYNLHYFEFLLDEKLSAESKSDIIHKWILENPVGKGSGWEPYPTSLRIINWIKWHWSAGELSAEAVESLWFQAKWLTDRPEYHLLGNHLFVNAKAMIFSAGFFGLNPNDNILKLGLKILLEEIEEQFLADGSHFELSPMYHALAMEDLIDLYNISDLIRVELPLDTIRDKIRKGLFWLEKFTYTNDELAHFNDCSNGIAPTLVRLKSYADGLGIQFRIIDSNEMNDFNKSGYIVFRNENIHLIADCGNIGPDYLPGHAHADTLSFELAIFGNRVIVNTGTGEYGKSVERLRQRGTSAHSTIEVDGYDSSEVWSGFRVARRARILYKEIETIADNIRFKASHSGYLRLKNRAVHSREWTISSGNCRINDYVSGAKNKVVSRFYLHPDLEMEVNNQSVVLKKYGTYLAEIQCDRNFELVQSTYFDRFGVKRNNSCILMRGATPFSSSLTISWFKCAE